LAYVAHIGKRRNAYTVLLEKTEEKDYFEDVGVRWENGVTLNSDE